MSKGQSIPLFIVVSAMSSIFLGWNSWLSVKTITAGEQASAVVQWEIAADKRFDSVDHRFDRLDDSVGSINSKIDLIAPRFGVNTRTLVFATTSNQ